MLTQTRTASLAQDDSRLEKRRSGLLGLAVLALRLLSIAAAVVAPLALLELGFRTFGPFLPGEYTLEIGRAHV